MCKGATASESASPQLEATTVAAASDGRRQRPRSRTALACALTHGLFGEQHSGTVRDIHEDGARIRPSCPPAVVTGPVRLEVQGRSYEGRVAWRTERELGLQFTAVAERTDAEPIAGLRLLTAQMRMA